MKTTRLLTASAVGLCAFTVFSAAPVKAANLLVGGYTLSNYASGLPGEGTIAGMSIDPVTRQIYYMSAGIPSTLRRLDPGGAVTALGTENPGGGFYPYIATDIEYYNGSVFTVDINGSLLRYSATAANYNPLVTLAGFSAETGMTRVGGTLYVTSGPSSAGIILTVDPDTAALNFPNLPTPFAPSSMEYDAVHNRLVVVAAGGFYTIDLATKTLGPAFGIGGAVNFCVDPTGTAVFLRTGDTLTEIDIATGAVTAFANGLDPSGFTDSVFGPSSSGGGLSLYIGDGNAIQEVSGFAVPEPASAALLLGGGALLGLRRRRG